MKKKAEHIALIGLLGALALVLGILENLLPPLPGMPPGAKAGLSNLVTMFAAGAIGLLFIAAIKGLFAFLTRGVSAGLMSLCGGLLSTLIMGILWKKTKFTPVFIGVCGAFGHNLAQLLVALWMTGFGALGYIPALVLYSVVCGICTGLLLQVLLPLLEKLPVLRK
jgi:heptaprenyl diphosphate synthase